MRLLTVIAVLAGTQTAFAMNWEGHDDWMVGFPPAQAFADAAPDARPPLPRDCATELIAPTDNPYEQIPLPQHSCALPLPDKSPEN